MPTSSRPLVAYVVQSGLRPKYGVYTDAYGLEMTFDDDWDVDVVMFSKPKLIEHIATQTGIHESSSISLGLTQPTDSNEYASWQLVDLTRRLARKQISPGLKPLIVARSVGDLERFTTAQSLLRDLEFAVSLRIDLGADAESFPATVLACRDMLEAHFAGCYRLLIYSTSTPEKLLEALPVAGIDGVFCPGSEYAEMLPLMSAAVSAFPHH
ncbi:hypothetical protein SV7mr_26850 [Stieleria bergensis]|uniref:Uncharacterized protein n=1 Tax=Stieleria bergensis TaxID=2528025 RepID=A0A517SVM4_9BACT|nr:hypothetical protein SV7mr_26850 [Planctomycetes bacterium SV_7m_r]